MGSDVSRTVSSSVSGVGATRYRVSLGRLDGDGLPGAEAQQPAGAGGLLGDTGELRGHPVAHILAIGAEQSSVQPETLGVDQHHAGVAMPVSAGAEAGSG